MHGCHESALTVSKTAGDPATGLAPRRVRLAPQGTVPQPAAICMQCCGSCICTRRRGVKRSWFLVRCPLHPQWFCNPSSQAAPLHTKTGARCNFRCALRYHSHSTPVHHTWRRAGGWCTSADHDVWGNERVCIAQNRFRKNEQILQIKTPNPGCWVPRTNTCTTKRCN